jgi:hypothetical protein
MPNRVQGETNACSCRSLLARRFHRTPTHNVPNRLQAGSYIRAD